MENKKNNTVAVEERLTGLQKFKKWYTDPNGLFFESEIKDKIDELIAEEIPIKEHLPLKEILIKFQNHCSGYWTGDKVWKDEHLNYEQKNEMLVKEFMEHLPIVEDGKIDWWYDERARNYAENKMPMNWNRSDVESVSLFYKYFIEYIENNSSIPTLLEEQPLKEDEKPLVNVYADEYVEKLWFEQPKDVQRKMKMAYLAGFYKNQFYNTTK